MRPWSTCWRDSSTVYRDLHAHPELSGQEHRTAGIAAAWLRDLGLDVVDGIGGTGVVGILRNGAGPTVLLRADMDGLPVTEATGLAYASTVEGVMHACGHDVHVTCLLGAADRLAAARKSWSGTLVLLLQPAEETVSGARAMVDDDLYTRVPRPDVVLGQHVAPLPAGMLGLRSGPAFAASDALRVTLHGAGGHGSRPESTVDPVVMAAATVMRLQTVVSREVAGDRHRRGHGRRPQRRHEGEHHPRRAPSCCSTFAATTRRSASSCSRRSTGSCGPRRRRPGAPPARHRGDRVGPRGGQRPGCRRRAPARALESVVGAGRLVDPGPVTGSEDVGVLAAAAGAPLVYWLLGGADPAAFAGAATPSSCWRVVAGAALQPLAAVRPGRGPDHRHRRQGAGRGRHGMAVGLSSRA